MAGVQERFDVLLCLSVGHHLSLVFLLSKPQQGSTETELEGGGGARRGAYRADEEEGEEFCGRACVREGREGMSIDTALEGAKRSCTSTRAHCRRRREKREITEGQRGSRTNNNKNKNAHNMKSTGSQSENQKGKHGGEGGRR